MGIPFEFISNRIITKIMVNGYERTILIGIELELETVVICHVINFLLFFQLSWYAIESWDVAIGNILCRMHYRI